MAYILILSPQAVSVLKALERDPKKHRKVIRCLALIEESPQYPGLHSHLYDAIKGSLGERIWESYVENNTPSAWRVWWFYGPGDDRITIYSIGPHP